MYFQYDPRSRRRGGGIIRKGDRETLFVENIYPYNRLVKINRALDIIYLCILSFNRVRGFANNFLGTELLYESLCP